ncbi:MAG TPA: IS110 family transposase [Candidatus Aminicenantes bacterium]|nr:IS110 family transposase [Candidatus Aminicenantes bacterium]
MRYFIGLDVHSNNTVIAVLDKKGKRIYSRRVKNFIKLVLEELEPFKDKIQALALESTFNWYWLADGLRDQGYEVHLANPSANKQYEGIKHTNDFSDAFFLAELLRLGILEEGYIYPRRERAIRDLLRKRLMLVRQRTAHILSFQSLYNRVKGCSFGGGNYVKRLKEDEMDDYFEEEDFALAAKTNIASIRFLTQQIEKLEKTVLKKIEILPEFEKLKTVTGIGDILALTIMLETGDIRRFPKVGNYASYCRCVPSERSSNKKKKGENNRKNGNKYLAWAYVEAANFATRYCSKAKRFYQRKSAKTNNIVATKALAHKLARASYFVMRDRVDYEPERLFG